MSAAYDPAARYALLGEDGAWRYVGQAWFVDDDGRRVEHDHVRMVQRTPDGETLERWVAPSEITGVFAGRTSLTSGVFVLGDSTIAG